MSSAALTQPEIAELVAAAVLFCPLSYLEHIILDCKHFDFGNGNCPFGTSCFYKHTVKPGSYVWKFHRPPPRRPPPRRYDIAPMDVIFHMFEHLEELDDYIFEDLENEDLNSWERESLMQMGLYTSDSSEDEIDLWP